MKKKELIFCGVLLVISALFVFGAMFITPLSQLKITSPGAYPLFVACLCLFSGLWVTVDTIKGRIVRATLPDWLLFDKDIACFIGIMAVYYVCLAFLHYTLATLIFTFIAIWFLKGKDWKKSLAVAIMCTAANLVIFKHVFSVIMP